MSLETLEDQSTDLGSVIELQKFISAVLGEGKFASNCNPTEILPASCRLLSAIAKKHSIIISNASKAVNQLSPKTKAQLSTVSLIEKKNR